MAAGFKDGGQAINCCFLPLLNLAGMDTELAGKLHHRGFFPQSGSGNLCFKSGAVLLPCLSGHISSSS